jgi:hypothetical protein
MHSKFHSAGGLKYEALLGTTLNAVTDRLRYPFPREYSANFFPSRAVEPWRFEGGRISLRGAVSVCRHSHMESLLPPAAIELDRRILRAERHSKPGRTSCESKLLSVHELRPNMTRGRKVGDRWRGNRAAPDAHRAHPEFYGRARHTPAGWVRVPATGRYSEPLARA